MRRKWTSSHTRVLVLCLASLSVAQTCEPFGPVSNNLNPISPDYTVDPAFVVPADPSDVPTGRYRSIDGTGNHQTYFHLGAAKTIQPRLMSVAYGDMIRSLAGVGRPNPRTVSNAVCDDSQRPANALGASDYLWQWGQFLDHDIVLTPEELTLEPALIDIPRGDPQFDPLATGVRTMDFFRSNYHHGTGTSTSYPRQQLNRNTHFLDASNVYGSDVVRAAALRTNDGTGRLAVSAGDLLPFNDGTLPNAGGSSAQLMIAGDIRANEQVALLALHTLFVREHNRLAAEFAAADPTLTGEEIYQEARRIVGAQMQVITYQEFLPALLGPNALSPSAGYMSGVSPAIFNEFAAAIFRFGHSALSSTLLRLDAALNPIPQGHLPLRDAFFRPDQLVTGGGIDPILRGLATQACAPIDPELNDDVRNLLFNEEGDGFDLAALNIQRGRDHGLPGYNVARVAVGLAPKQTFEEITSDPSIQVALASTYAQVDDIDIWVGTLAEDPFNGGHVGELAFEVIVRQFEALRDGDRYWYEWNLTPEEIAEVESTTLADIIRRNTSIGNEISDDVFHVN
jgi:peroxidase